MDIMTSNVFTKKDILQNLASRGCFIDIYTLDAFFAKKKIEAIFEDSQGNEFYDNNALNIVLEGILNNQQQNIQEQKPNSEDTLKLDDTETLNILDDIKLSDGTPLKDKVQNIENIEINDNNIQNDTAAVNDIANRQEAQTLSDNTNPTSQISDNSFQENVFEQNPTDIFSSDITSGAEETANFDDITLLSESFEAQEKLRQYVMSELSRNNLDVAPQRAPSNNEFKLDISERTLNMIARTMARKIAKYVGSIMAQDAKDSSKVAQYEEENRRLTQKARELEEQNRKLRLLLAESNKNLNSYKPSFFGLYKKVDPKANKK